MIANKQNKASEKMRKIESHAVKGDKNSLRYWHYTTNPIRVCINFALLWLGKWLPSLSAKNWLYRIVGVQVGKNASIAAGVSIDFFFPELIEIGENTIIGFDSLLLAHEYLQHEWRTGSVKIGKNVLIGARCTIMPGVEIGDNAVISACSLVNHDVPAGAFVGGVPARVIRRKN